MKHIFTCQNADYSFIGNALDWHISATNNVFKTLLLQIFLEQIAVDEVKLSSPAASESLLPLSKAFSPHVLKMSCS